MITLKIRGYKSNNCFVNGHSNIMKKGQMRS